MIKHSRKNLVSRSYDNSILMLADSKINQESHNKILPFSSNGSSASFSSLADPSCREEDQYFNAKRGIVIFSDAIKSSTLMY